MMRRLDRLTWRYALLTSRTRIASSSPMFRSSTFHAASMHRCAQYAEMELVVYLPMTKKRNVDMFHAPTSRAW